jgi:hypothetical protein
VRGRAAVTANPGLTQKRSVTLAGGLIAEVEALAGPRGVSAATAEALVHWVARTRLRRAIEAHEAEVCGWPSAAGRHRAQTDFLRLRGTPRTSPGAGE